jgi:hypothetical protein
MKNDLTKIPPIKLIHDRLQIIFPPGTQNRTSVTREMAAKIIFVMFYTGAIESNDVWLRPDQVTKMLDAQAERKTQDERIEWRKLSLSPGKLSDVQDR